MALIGDPGTTYSYASLTDTAIGATDVALLEGQPLAPPVIMKPVGEPMSSSSDCR
ncbi:hypothetical protein IG631_04401 [Alternaria alternata]|nr:hypothetical protein IG631_04401 [Alternaria alternata]